MARDGATLHCELQTLRKMKAADRQRGACDVQQSQQLCLAVHFRRPQVCTSGVRMRPMRSEVRMSAIGTRFRLERRFLDSHFEP